MNPLTAAYRPEEVIAAYVKVLQELSGLKGLARAPEEVLPLPKGELEALLHGSTHPNKDQLLSVLPMFQPGASSLFLARLVSRPILLSFVYTVAISLQGASWLWVPLAILGGVGAFFATSGWAWDEAWPTLSRVKRWGWIFGLQLAELAAITCWAAIWVRLVFRSGLYGLYESVWLRLDPLGIVAALLSLVLGYLFSNQLNAFFFFVTQYTKLRRFRSVSR